MVEITISYGETHSKDYNSEKHELSINISLTEDQLLERSVQQWFFYYNNMLKKAVREMFGTEKEIIPEKKGVTTITYDTVVEEPIINQETYDETANQLDKAMDPTNIIYGSVKTETEKAYLIIDSKGERELWVPKSCLKSGDAKSTKFVVHDWFVEKLNWSVV